MGMVLDGRGDTRTVGSRGRKQGASVQEAPQSWFSRHTGLMCEPMCQAWPAENLGSTLPSVSVWLTPLSPSPVQEPYPSED